MSLFSRIRKAFHVHSWCGSAWNGYYIEHEQRCACGSYRHRILDAATPLGQAEPWIDGEHPGARALREKGIEKTACWLGLVGPVSPLG